MSHFSVSPPPLAKSHAAFSLSVFVGIQLKSEKQNSFFFLCKSEGMTYQYCRHLFLVLPMPSKSWKEKLGGNYL